MAYKEHRNKKLVLVVDDDQGIQDLTKDILELYGHTVLTAGQDEAADLCEQRGKDFSVVLLDVMESETAAFDIFQRILAVNPTARVIITSSDSNDFDSRGMFGRGSAGYLKKPYRMTELVRMVEGYQDIGNAGQHAR
jgi:two-component system cell cycle sensor histidine kinase/response regulator CckA